MTNTERLDRLDRRNGSALELDAPTRDRDRAMDILRLVGWLVAGLVMLCGGGLFFLCAMDARDSINAAAYAAIGCLVVITAYCTARAATFTLKAFGWFRVH